MTTTFHPMLTVGERLSIARSRADVKVGKMAELLGRHRNMVTAYESSDDAPLWVLRKYAEVLGNDTTLEWLSAEVGDPPLDLRGSGSRFGCIHGSMSRQLGLFGVTGQAVNDRGMFINRDAA